MLTSQLKKERESLITSIAAESNADTRAQLQQELAKLDMQCMVFNAKTAI